MFERIRRRVPQSVWNDILKVMHLYSDGVLTDADVSALLSQACASPSNDLSILIEDFMTRCAFFRFLWVVLGAYRRRVLMSAAPAR